jgi:hypothetical protein
MFLYKKAKNVYRKPLTRKSVNKTVVEVETKPIKTKKTTKKTEENNKD